MSHSPITDPIFGELIWNPEYRWWRGRVDLTPKHTIGVDIDWDEETPLDELMSNCRETYERLRREEHSLRVRTAGELFKTFGQLWIEHEVTDTMESVARRIWVLSVTLYGDGAAELWYQDDGLFWKRPSQMTVPSVHSQINPDGTIEDVLRS